MTRLVAGAAALAVALPALVGFDPYFLYVGAGAWLWAALATAWAVPALAGQVSFGQAAYFGVGGYTSALLAQRADVSPWLGVLAAASAGGAAGVPMGLAGGRVRGAYLALVTFAYAETLRAAALDWAGLTGGGSGLIGLPDLPPLPLVGAAGGRGSAYYLALGLFGASVALAAALRRGRIGLAWAAIREREDRAAQLGVSVVPYKVLAFACSGAVTGAGGALFVHAARVVEPDLAFGRGVSVLPLVMALFGGARPLLGPALGAVLLHGVSELVFQPLWPQLHQLPYGLALVTVLLVLPRGLAGSGRRA
jgi:branched-chain amino acid transport system permease protein